MREFDKEQEIFREKTRLKLINAAKEVFLTHGYAKSKLDYIIDIAGGSRRNIYNIFGSKEELFLEMLKQTVSEIFNTSEDEYIFEYTNLEDALTNLGTKSLFSIFQKENIKFLHLILTESIQYPEIYTKFNNTVMYYNLKLPLIKIFQKARENNELTTKLDDEFIADFAIATIRGIIDPKILYFYNNGVVTEDYIKNIISNSLTLIINGLCNTQK